MTLDRIPNHQAAIDKANQAIGPDPATTPTTTGHTWWNWTPTDLRGIPAIGRGVTGTIPETEPGWNLDQWPIPDEGEAA